MIEPFGNCVLWPCGAVGRRTRVPSYVQPWLHTVVRRLQFATDVSGIRADSLDDAVNLINAEDLGKAYGPVPLLDGVSLGVSAGDRIGVVGRNGDGKTTLVSVLAGRTDHETGRVTRTRDLRLGYLTQRDEFPAAATVRSLVFGDRAEHDWAGDARARDILAGLLPGVSLDAPVAGMSGGERRRVALARLLVPETDLIILDEPTNHLDIEAIAWLAGHLKDRTPDRRNPRPVVPRRGDRPHVGGRGRAGPPVRRRLLRVRPGQGRACPHRRVGRGEAPEPPAQGAGLAAPRAARRARPSRSSASTPRTP